MSLKVAYTKIAASRNKVSDAAIFISFAYAWTAVSPSITLLHTYRFPYTSNHSLQAVRRQLVRLVYQLHGTD